MTVFTKVCKEALGGWVLLESGPPSALLTRPLFLLNLPLGALPYTYKCSFMICIAKGIIIRIISLA